MKEFGGIDSKFRYVILASMRAKELLRGSKPKIKSKSKNLIRVAQEEALLGLIKYEIVKPGNDDIHEIEDDMFIGEEIGAPIEEPEPEIEVEPEAPLKAEAKVKKEAKTKKAPEKAKDKLKKEKEALKAKKQS
ncbi:DNA-directed RNA polymerase subunit omega [Acidobacteriota bacterium]